jgi:predicted DNA-binding transcriptional regulator YafY/predicted RNA-binding protein with RPS1 domain
LRVSHDTDKLIRQLSLVAFLMAERRPITARDVKSNVEGYSEMSDEAFARRFYSDRAELLSLGVPLQSQRDEFTGEELYTLRSEQYFLPELELEDEELAALQTALYLLEGKFAYAEPLRLALQNLALGRPGFTEPGSDTAQRVEVLDPDYSPEMPGRLAKLEGAISKQRTVKFEYWSISRDHESERTLNPYALMPDNGIWYVVGYDLDRDDIRTFRVSRIRGDIKFATRRERDFRVPADFDIDKERISLGIKQLANDPFEKVGAVAKKGDVVTVIVAGIQDNGIDVTVKEGIPGFIRKSELSRDRSEQRPDRYAIGDKLDAKITNIDKASRRVVLSVKARELDEEKKAMADFGSSDSGASLGDILGAALSRAQKKDEKEEEEEDK